MNDPKKVSRRTAIKLIGAGTAQFALAGCSHGLLHVNGFKVATDTNAKPGSLDSLLPIDRGIVPPSARLFSGDEPERAHQVLWNIDAVIGSGASLSKHPETATIVVIGGGVSGLMTAYLLRDHKPIILEQASRFGGNARGESWSGIDYSIGSAYFSEQPLESPLRKIYSEIGIDRMMKVKTTEDPIFWRRKRFDHFWDGETDPARRREITKLRDYFKMTLEGSHGHAFPDIPVLEASKRAYIDALDRKSFREHLEKTMKGPLHPHAMTAIERYCWSAFGASSSEISAAAGLNFYSSEFGGICVAPGGNSAIAEQLVKKLSQTVPPGHLRARSIVCRVEVQPDSALVTYVKPNGELGRIRAQAVIMACPKFVAGRILHEIEPERSAAIHKLRYRSYLVANVLIDQPVSADRYDLFLMKEVDPTSDLKRASAVQGATDVICATYARPHPTKTVLTLYRGLPYDGARASLYSSGAYESIRNEFETQIRTEILPAYDLDASRVVDLRITRWGHPLPLADKGLISSGIIDQIRKPFGDRVFFVEQDNWMLPAIETSLTEALTWAPKILDRIRGTTST